MRADLYEPPVLRPAAWALNTSFSPIVPLTFQRDTLFPELDTSVIDPGVKACVLVRAAPSLLLKRRDQCIELSCWNVRDRGETPQLEQSLADASQRQDRKSVV